MCVWVNILSARAHTTFRESFFLLALLQRAAILAARKNAAENGFVCFRYWRALMFTKCSRHLKCLEFESTVVVGKTQCSKNVLLVFKSNFGEFANFRPLYTENENNRIIIQCMSAWVCVCLFRICFRHPPHFPPAFTAGSPCASKHYCLNVYIWMPNDNEVWCIYRVSKRNQLSPKWPTQGYSWMLD